MWPGSQQNEALRSPQSLVRDTGKVIGPGRTPMEVHHLTGLGRGEPQWKSTT
jgi:hypothetical protein